MNTPLRSDVLTSLGRIPRPEWNRLASPDGLYSSHEWLTAIEGEATGECAYAVVRQGDRLMAALPVYFVTDTGNPYYEPRAHFPGIAPAQPVHCLAGGLGGYRNAPLVEPGLPTWQRQQVLRRLFDTVQEAVAARGFESTALLFLTAEGVERTIAARDGMPNPTLAYAGDAVLDVVGDSFEDYRRSLSKNRNATVRNELNRFLRAGLTVSVEDPRDSLDLVVRLAGQLNEKYGRVTPAAELERSLVRQLRELGDRARLFVCKDGNTPIGVALGYDWHGQLYLRLAGFDYPQLRAASEYFTLLVYEPLRYCYDHGLRGLHLGAASHQAKAGRGARIEPLMCALLPCGPGAPEEPVPPEDRAEVRQYWEEQMRELRTGFDPDVWRHAMELSRAPLPLRTGR